MGGDVKVEVELEVKNEVANFESNGPNAEVYGGVT